MSVNVGQSSAGASPFSANAAVISNLTPLVLLGVASRAFHEKVTGLLVAITGVATIGVALVLFGSSQHTTWQPWGDALAFVSMFFFAAYFALSDQPPSADETSCGRTPTCAIVT